MKELTIDQMSEILKNLLHAKEIGLLAPTTTLNYDICVSWEIPYLKHRTPESFVEYFADLLMPFGDLLRISQTPRILELTRLLEKEKADHLETSQKLLKLSEEYRVYTQAIRDCKG